MRHTATLHLPYQFGDEVNEWIDKIEATSEIVELKVYFRDGVPEKTRQEVFKVLREEGFNVS